MIKDNGVNYAIAAVAGFAAVAHFYQGRGSSNDEVEGQEWEVVEAPKAKGQLVRAQSHGGHLQARRSAEMQLPDRQLARRIFSDGDVMGRMTFAQAARHDPRRVDALISQRIGRAFREVFGRGPGPEGEQLYLMGVDLARKSNQGAMPVKAIVSLVEENLDRALFSTFPRMPPPVKRQLRDQMPVFEEAFMDAGKIARDAMFAAEDPEDRREWKALAEYLEGHPAQMRVALADALPGPAGRPAMAQGRQRMLPAPRGGGNRGSRYECKGCRGASCPIHD
jgi:hypothetical protein